MTEYLPLILLVAIIIAALAFVVFAIVKQIKGAVDDASSSSSSPSTPLLDALKKELRCDERYALAFLDELRDAGFEIIATESIPNGSNP